jgi:hypothetical protein
MEGNRNPRLAHPAIRRGASTNGACVHFRRTRTGIRISQCHLRHLLASDDGGGETHPRHAYLRGTLTAGRSTRNGLNECRIDSRRPRARSNIDPTGYLKLNIRPTSGMICSMSAPTVAAPDEIEAPAQSGTMIVKIRFARRRDQERRLRPICFANRIRNDVG